MSKRFTDTDKWKKSFIKSLPAEYKLFWLFICDECDHSGIWHVEIEVAEARLGLKLSIEKIRQLFRNKIIEFDDGNKMFVPDFIHFQYGNLNPLNKAHASVLYNLKKYDLMGHISPLQGAKDKAKDMDKDKEGEENSKFLPTGLIYDLEFEFTKNPEAFKRICMSAHKKEKQARDALRKYHLWLTEKERYPMSRNAIFAGFEKWLLNEKEEVEKGKPFELTGAPPLKYIN